jgi:hypothetical protein
LTESAYDVDMPNLARTTISLLLFSASTAAAEPVIRETVVHDTTSQVQLRLDPSTVLCSSADYGALFLKVLIPELSALTLLDHQNTGAGAPCVASGPCLPGNMPSDILSGMSPYEATSINVKAIRIDEADAEAQTCTTMLRETVDVTIRGIAFTHERFASLGDRPFSDCATASAPAQVAPKTDGPAMVEPASSGGCSTGQGGSGLVLLGLATLLVALKRRS